MHAHFARNMLVQKNEEGPQVKKVKEFSQFSGDVKLNFAKEGSLLKRAGFLPRPFPPQQFQISITR